MNRILCLALFVGLFNFNAFADNDKNYQHHEDLTEAQLGTVHFPSACSASVQHPFERGVALLHSFWYEEAEKEFLEVAKNDPHCAMAHWGVAMSLWHQLWNEPDAKVIARGLSESEKAAAASLDSKSGPRTAAPADSDHKTEVLAHERAYITAITAFYSDSAKLDHAARAKAYSDAMKKVYEAYPEDHEAAAFYALSLLASEPHHDGTFANRKAAAAVLE